MKIYKQLYYNKPTKHRNEPKTYAEKRNHAFLSCVPEMHHSSTRIKNQFPTENTAMLENRTFCILEITNKV